MLVEMFVIYQVIVIGLFFTAFFTKQEIIWVITLVMSSILMYTAYNIEYYVYELNTTLGAYQPVITTHSYPYLMGINLIFAVLCLILGLFDLFEKYGIDFVKGKQ